MTPEAGAPDLQAQRETKEIKAILVLVVLASLYTTFAVALPWYAEMAPFDEISIAIAQQLFETYVVPFEALSITLLAALIGALYIAARGGERR